MSALLPGAIAFLIGLATLTAQAPPPAAAGAAPIIENERVTVWDFSWKKGERNPIGRRSDDCVIVYLSPNAGQVIFQPKGSVSPQPGGPDGATWRAKLVALRDRPAPPRPTPSRFPNAFPREGAKVLLENARVTVWDYTFSAGSPSPMHFHDKDVVVTYIGDGALRSSPPEGQGQTNEYVFGDTRFNLANRTHSELLTRGNLRIIAMELK